MLALYFLSTDSPDVDFCGYTITHPSESKINFRIQTRGEIRPSAFVLSSCSFYLIFFFLKVQSHFLFSTQEKKQQHFLSVTYTVLILMVKIAVIVIIVVIVVFNLECCCYFILKSQAIHKCTWFLCCFHVQTDGSNNYCIFQIQYWNSSAEDEEKKKNHPKRLKTEMLRHASRVSHCINNYRGIWSRHMHLLYTKCLHIKAAPSHERPV